MPDDNGGRCECCNKPETEFQEQRTYPIMLGAGLGKGTMWLCPECLREHQLRDERKKNDKVLMLLGGL